MIIRQENLNDYEKVYTCIKLAFENAEFTDGNEQDLVTALRLGKSYIPELSLVAETDGNIVGHIMFTKAMVGNEVVLALAPVSVLPEFQGQGVGKALITMGHKIAQQLGYNYSVVLGNENYYSKFGYTPASSFGIKPPFEVPNEKFMANKLCESSPTLNGIMKYAKEFGIE